MYKIKKLIILFLLLIPIAFAQDFSNYQSLDMNFSINSHLKIIPTTQNPIIKSLQATISLSPKEDARQKILSSKTITSPSATVNKNQNIILSWSEITDTEYIYFNILSDIQTTNIIPKISSKISYPFSLDSSLLPYIQEAEYININPEIRAKAKELAKEKTDLYEIIFAVSNWTNNNIKYDLDTLTASAIQKSSWVFKNRRGVCDEITNLFISLLRSLNIPAKFIAGTVHSNLMGGWGNHGWAEVYIPNHGWIPFDITLGQYGWIDPSHLKLSESIDSARPTINYKWRSTGVKLKPSSLNIETYLKNTNGEIPQQILISIKPLAEKVGFNSFVPLKVTVKNLMNYYLIPKIYLTKSPKPTTSTEKVLFLKPKEKQVIFWLLKIPSLSTGYQYNSPIETTSSFGNTANSKIKISNMYKTLTLEEASKRIKTIAERELKKLFPDLTISCFPDYPYYYPRTNIYLKCTLENTGTKKDLNLCIQDICQKISLSAKAKKDINFQTLAEPEIEIFAENENYIKYASLKPEIIQVPDIHISNIEPVNMNYNEEIELKFTLATDYPAKNLKLYLNNKNIYETASLDRSRGLKIKLNSKSLVSGAKFKITYQDTKGKEYTTTKKYLTTVRNTPFFVKLFSWLL